MEGEFYRLPEGWRWVRLGEVCEIASGGTPKRSVPTYWGGDIPWVKISDIPADGCVSRTEEGITRDGVRSSGAKIFPEGTLLFSIFGTVGKVGVLRIPAATNQAIAGIRIIRADIEPKFMFFALRLVAERAKSASRGMAQGNINLSILRALPVPVPALAEQRRIVARIEELMEGVREAKRLRDQAREDAERLWRSVLADTFPRPGSHLPEGWRWVRLGEVARRKAVILKPSDYPCQRFRYLGMEHVATAQWDEPEGVEVEGQVIKSQVVAFHPGLVLYGKLRPYLNKVVVPSYEGVASTEFVPIEPDASMIHAKYLGGFLRTASFVAYAVRHTTGSRQPRTRLDALWGALIPLPPLSEQRRIVAHLEAMQEKIRALKCAQAETDEELKRLDQSILDKALRGEL